MKILQRYVFKELWLPIALCFFTLNFIFMAGYLVRAANFIIGRGVPLTDTMMVLILALPEMIGYTLPMSILTAILIVYGNLSQNNEIRAIKASGIHPFHVMLPALLVGLIASFGMVIFSDQIASNAGFQLRKTTKQMMIKHPRALIEPGRFVQVSDTLKFFTKELNGNQMKDIAIYEVQDPTKPVRVIIAESGEIVSKNQNTEIAIRLYNGSISDAENKGVQSIQFKTYEFPSFGQANVSTMQKKLRDLTLAEILFRLTSRDLSRKDRAEAWTAFHNRLAFAFGSFIFVFMGVPIAILVRRGEIVLSFGISMLVACFYYVLFVGAKTVSMEGILHPLIAHWLPNILLLAVGANLLKRSIAA